MAHLSRFVEDCCYDFGPKTHSNGIKAYCSCLLIIYCYCFWQQQKFALASALSFVHPPIFITDMFCAICVYHFLSKLKLQIVCRAQYGWYFGKFHFDFRRLSYLFISILDISPKSLTRFNRLHALKRLMHKRKIVYLL